MANGPKLTLSTSGYYDLEFEDGSFVWCEDGTQAAVHCVTRLLVFKGEKQLDEILTSKKDQGTDWYGKVFDTSKSIAEKQLEIKRIILGTPGINKIRTFGWEQTGRSVNTDGTKVDTDWGDDEDITATVTAL